MKILIVLMCYVLLVFSSQSFAQDPQTSTYSQKMLLKNWALARCLKQVYGDSEASKDANATASAYLEYGKQPLDVYNELGKIVDKYANLSYGSSIKSDLNTMKCIDLFNSKELENSARKLSKVQLKGKVSP